ncbi:unnamed protein product, partial [Ectocarpus sp. 6 AP-2014]
GCLRPLPSAKHASLRKSCTVSNRLTVTTQTSQQRQQQKPFGRYSWENTELPRLRCSSPNLDVCGSAHNQPPPSPSRSCRDARFLEMRDQWSNSFGMHGYE